MSLTTEISRVRAQGAKEVAGFTGGVRPVESQILEVGMEWTFPTEYKVYERDFEGNKAQFIFIEVAPDKFIPFYPSTFTKSRAIYNEDLTLTGERIHTTGTAAEAFQKYGTVKEAMEAMKGKKVRVTNINTIRTKRYGVNELQDAQIPVIDFVE